MAWKCGIGYMSYVGDNCYAHLYSVFVIFLAEVRALIFIPLSIKQVT